MKICFPVLTAKGVDSEVYGHFGSATAFVIVDTESSDTATINNNDQHHAHGACSPMKALNNQSIDAVVVAGIGQGALSRLNQLGIKVFQAKAPTIKENIELFRAQNLPEFTAQHTCPGHGHMSGCKH
jgi:predicted Fe-Mo cluster-binding NifX family protein